MSSTNVSHMLNNVALKEEIASILGLGSDSFESWDVRSSIPEEHLYLVHYKTDHANGRQNANPVDMEKYGNLRGVVVDTQAKAVVCRSFGYTPTAVANQLTPDENGLLTLNDLNGTTHTIDFKTTRIKAGFEGTIMRVFLHNGQVRRATHRHINPINSRWGKSVSFNEMYDQLNGPAYEELFDLSKKYSPFVHMFLMVHPDVLSCTKQNVGSGYIVYLGSKQMWTPETCPYPAEETETVAKVPNGISTIPSVITKPEVINAFDWSLEQANEHLRWGFYEPFDERSLTDSRLGCGEFVMLYRYDDEGHVTGLLKVASPAYQWRCDVRDNDPNLTHRLYQLVDASYIAAETMTGLRQFLARFPLIYPYQAEDIIQRIQQEGPRILWVQPAVATTAIATKEDRLYNVWICLMMAVPLHLQAEVAQAYQTLIQDRASLVTWLQQLYNTQKYLNDDRLPSRLVAIINQAENFARLKTERGENRDRFGRLMRPEMMTRDNIRNLIYKERGASLYRLVKAMREASKERV